MGKIFWTTIFWALVLVIAGFYVKFMDQEVGVMFTDRLINKPRDINYTEETAEDPMDKVVSGIESIQQQLSEINAKLEGENVNTSQTLTNTGAKKPETTVFDAKTQ